MNPKPSEQTGSTLSITLRQRPWIWLVPVLLATCFMSIDGTLYWDEPGYLYAGIYQTFDEIAGSVQPSGIPNFTTGKLFHVLFIHSVYQVIRDPPAVFFVVAGIYTLALIATLVTAQRITSVLLQEQQWSTVGVLATSAAPIISYLAFKTLADIPSLFLSALSSYAVLKAAQVPQIRWVAFGSVALALAALTKVSMVLLPASLVVAIALFPVGAINRFSALKYGTIFGVVAGALTLLTLKALSVDLDSFLGSSDLFRKKAPMAAKVMHVAIEAGFIYLLLPLSFFSVRRRELKMLWTWYAIGTLPFLVLFEHVEPRFISANIIPLAGIVGLSLEVLWTKASELIRNNLMKALVMCAGASILTVGAHRLALMVMPHEVDLFELRRMINSLDESAFEDPFTILTAWRFTDFHILRVIWPERPVYCVDTTPIFVSPDKDHSAEVERYLKGRQIDGPQSLRDIPGPYVYLGFGETFAPANLKNMVALFHPQSADKLVQASSLTDHFSTGWVWNAPEVEVRPRSGFGYYKVFDVLLRHESEQIGSPTEE